MLRVIGWATTFGVLRECPPVHTGNRTESHKITFTTRFESGFKGKEQQCDPSNYFVLRYRLGHRLSALSQQSDEASEVVHKDRLWCTKIGCSADVKT